MRRIACVVLAVITVGGFARLSSAQAPPRRGRIVVTVSDQSGLVVPDASVRGISQDAPAGALETYPHTGSSLIYSASRGNPRFSVLRSQL